MFWHRECDKPIRMEEFNALRCMIAEMMRTIEKLSAASTPQKSAGETALTEQLIALQTSCKTAKARVSELEVQLAQEKREYKELSESHERLRKTAEGVSAEQMLLTIEALKANNEFLMSKLKSCMPTGVVDTQALANEVASRINGMIRNPRY